MTYLNYAIKGRVDHWSKNLVPKFIFVLLLGASLSPVLMVLIPAMDDYPNHLAQMFILCRSSTPHPSPFYQVVWAWYPNLAMDLLIPPLAHLISVENATRLFLFISQVLIITGAIAIERVVKGCFKISGFAALMFLYCLPFTWGFLNFEFGLGISLWGIAVWLMVQERPWPVRLVVNSFCVAALFTAHFFAFGIYGATVGLHELWRAWDRKAAYFETALRLVVLAIPAVPVLVAMAFTVGSIGGVGTSWAFEAKPFWLLRIMNGYSWRVSATSVVMLIALLYVAGKRGVLKCEPAGLWMAIGFTILYLAIPSRLFSSFSFVDLRVIAAAALILPAFCSLSLPNRRWKLVTISCVTSITLANLAVVVFVWISYRADYAAMIESFRKIDKGSLVLVAHNGGGGGPSLGFLLDYPNYPIWHAPTLAAHYADAFVPTLFAAVGQQPVTARRAYQHLVVLNGGVVPVALLKAIAENEAPNAPAFIRSWQHDFDYLYVIGPRIPNPMPGNLEELDVAPRFVLYKIRK